MLAPLGGPWYLGGSGSIAPGVDNEEAAVALEALAGDAVRRHSSLSSNTESLVVGVPCGLLVLDILESKVRYVQTGYSSPEN